MQSAKSRDAQRRSSLGLRVRQDVKRRPTEVAVGHGRAHRRVPALDGEPRHHECGRDRHARRIVRDASWTPANSQRQRAPVFRSTPPAMPEASERKDALPQAQEPLGKWLCQEPPRALPRPVPSVVDLRGHPSRPNASRRLKP